MQGGPVGPGVVTADDIAGADDWSEGAVHRGRLRVRTLVTLRWLVVGGETALLLVVMSLGFAAPFPLCFAVVGAGAWINLLTRVASPGRRVFGDVEAATQLGLDILQISTLVFLTGGASNPFVLMLIAPVTLAAATLSLRPVLALGVLTAVLSGLLAFYSFPLPEIAGAEVVIPVSYRIGAALANIAGVGASRPSSLATLEMVASGVPSS
jgi:two-component system sensor histidine kinase RegB